MNGRVLVVGGAGYIGSVLVRSLLRSGISVVVYDRMLYGSASLDSLRCERLFVMHGDTRDITRIHDCMRGCESVVYLAELVGDPICSAFPVEAFETNELAPICAVRMARSLGVRRFVYMSSCSAYGLSADPNELLTETSPLNPQTSYARFKIAVENEIARDPSIFVVLRLGTVFGVSPRPRFDLVVNQMTSMAVLGEPIEVLGGSQWRPFVSVQDVANAVMAALSPELDVGGKVLNIAYDNIRIADLAAAVSAQIPADVEVRGGMDMKDLRNYRVSSERARLALGLTPALSIADGVVKVAATVDRHGPSHLNPRCINVNWYRGDGH